MTEIIGNSMLTRPWFKWFWRIMVLFWLVMLIPDLLALLRGTPDLYPQQHVRGLLGCVGSIFLAMAFLVTRRSIAWIMIAGSFATLFFSAALKWFE